jgi:hypothetical protein
VSSCYLETDIGFVFLSLCPISKFIFLYMWSEDRFPATAPTLADFLNWMPSTATQDAGDTEELQESAEAALAATSQGI